MVVVNKLKPFSNRSTIKSLKMNKLLIVLCLFASSSLMAQFDFQKAVDKGKEKLGSLTNGAGLSNEDIGKGLKEALNKGVNAGVDKLGAVDGYFKSELYKILIPEDMRNVVSKLKMVPGFGNIENELMEKMNKGAEKAVTKATPIYTKAITSLTFQDALNILMGEKNAATQYLNKTTNQELYKEFNPIIASSLSEVGATKYWSDCVNAYNNLPFVKKANPDFNDYVTKEALKGLFGMVAEKELEIRNDPRVRNTEMLRKVFAKQDKK